MLTKAEAQEIMDKTNTMKDYVEHTGLVDEILKTGIEIA